MAVLQCYIAVNTEPTELNYLMPVCKKSLPIAHLTTDSNFTVVVMHFTFTSESAG
jgi:hypothetical protein